ncbi:RNA polymerase sigma factor [Agromyces sp. SYSU K20354]|uniref:RNA polymerase sigma factor n=1 Tax=Agromyces cavernae TaxID=2898659 RepID=UPI001E41B453|nr:RNA polymerase sigma factor [Agromyces cavernae]MCD2441602.1 RNA polymerase sigma factor [Agromyces cavernae]
MGEDLRTDAALWLEATSGTEASFGVVYDRYRVRILRRAYAQVLDVADAEDIVAIVFLEAWRRRKDVRFVDGSLLPWLLVVTTNVTLNSQRAMRRHRRLLASIPTAEPAVDPSREIDDRLDVQLMSARLRDALRRLTPAERRVVELCLVEGLPLADAAAALDAPLGSVKSRLSRARRKLQAELGDSPWPADRPAAPTSAPVAQAADDLEVIG